jgi:hypothetical protein
MISLQAALVVPDVSAELNCPATPSAPGAWQGTEPGTPPLSRDFSHPGVDRIRKMYINVWLDMYHQQLQFQLEL